VSNRDNAPEYLIIGQVVGSWGVRGESKVSIITDFPERFSSLKRVYLGEGYVPYKVQHARLHKRWALIKFVGVDDPADARALAGQYVCIPIAEAMPLAADEYYEHQILGLAVWTDEGEYLGRIAEILFTGSNDVYVVQGEGELLIPALKDVVLRVDLEQGRMIVHLLEGLR